MTSVKLHLTPQLATVSRYALTSCLGLNTLALSAFILSAFILSALALTGCDQRPEYGYLEGETMGTSYHIRYLEPKAVDKQTLQQAIDARLVAINNSMSTYQDDSTISKFNQLPAGQALQVDDDFIRVLGDAKQVYRQSGGAFDPTVMPLVNLWGFGRTMTVDRLQSPPSLQEIEAAKALIDFDSVRLNGQQLSKTKDGVAVDFSAIAKGYGVDVIAQVLHDTYQINDYMVEIGGEVATAGLNAQAQPWQIAIDAPVLNTGVGDRQLITTIRQPTPTQQMHLATSGNYRNSVVFDGKRYSHTIDPTTGQPIAGGAPSVSVLADTVSLADAWATALTAMPYAKALATATDHNIAALFVIPASGHLSDRVSSDTLDNGESSAQDSANKPLWKIVQTPAMQVLRRGDDGDSNSAADKG